jgi:hypothetical protein
MLLVLISLMMATVLTTSYLASRDNSAAIGQNAAAAAAARWAAESGVDFAAAILETEKAWRTAHSGGRLVSNFSLAGATLNIDLLDLETNQPPNAATENVRVTITATVDGVTQTAVGEARVPVITSPVADVDLSEFAVFTSSRLEMRGDSTLARWPKAPLSVLGDRVFLGTRATNASSIALSDNAAAVDTTVYHGPGASALLVAVARGQAPEQITLPDPIPLPNAPAAGVIAPGVLLADVTQNGGNITVSVNARHNAVDLRNGGTRTLRGNITVVTDDALRIRENAKLIIDGNVKVVVFGDLRLETGSIELKPGAKLTMFVRGKSPTSVDIRDGYIGDVRAINTRDATGAASYMDPERLTIYSMAGAPASDWQIIDNSVIKGSIYAPTLTALHIEDQSAVYGRIASTTIGMSESATLFYDPSLNERAGFSKLSSPLYDANGRLKAPFASLTSLDTSVVQAAADATGALVKTVTGLLSPSGYVAPSTGAAGPTDPTPRTVHIDFQLVSLGDALRSWE